MKNIKRLIWAYFWLIIFEGALRKWLVPGLSDALLIIRDPIVVLIYILASSKGKLPMNGFIMGFLFLGILSSLTAIAMGHGNPIVAIYGFRTNFFHVPLIFVIGRVFDRDDVLKVAHAMMWLTLGMTVLISLQFLSPQSSFVNRSVGGIEGGGFDGADGRYRPPGTFSFITGLAMYYPLATAMLMALATDQKLQRVWLLAAAGCAIVLAIPLSISRSLALSVVVVLVGGVSFLGYGGFRIGKILKIAAIFIVAGVGAQFIPVFSEATSAFASRWEASTTDKGGFEEAIFDRFVSELTDPFVQALGGEVFGIGSGGGTNVGARFLVGDRAFLAGEGELFRVLGEFGLFIGLIYLFMRWSILYKMLEVSMNSAKRKNFVPGFIFCSSAIWIVRGQWGPPTLLGFAILAAGLCLAAANIPEDEDEEIEDSEETEDDEGLELDAEEMPLITEEASHRD